MPRVGSEGSSLKLRDELHGTRKAHRAVGTGDERWVHIGCTRSTSVDALTSIARGPTRPSAVVERGTVPMTSRVHATIDGLLPAIDAVAASNERGRSDARFPRPAVIVEGGPALAAKVLKIAVSVRAMMRAPADGRRLHTTGRMSEQNHA